MKKLAILFLLLAAVAPVGCKSITDKNAKADKMADAILAAAAANDVDKICNEMLSTEARLKVPREKWETIFKIASMMGNPSNVNRINFTIGSFNGQTVGEYKYDVTWEKGPGTMTLGLLWDGEGWKAQSIYFNSDALRKMMASQSQSQSQAK